MTEVQHKPTTEEWLSWANVVIDRLTECAHIYGQKEPLPAGIFMADAERQKKTNATVSLLRRIYILVDQLEMPTASVSDAHIHDEHTIRGLTVLFDELLQAMPELSTDMQKLLQSQWHSKFPNQAAETLFYGQKDESHGIGSGNVEHGRLPATLAELIEREQVGITRLPREDLLRHGEPRRNDPDSRRRWVEQNSKFLRSAGRVE